MPLQENSPSFLIVYSFVSVCCPKSKMLLGFISNSLFCTPTSSSLLCRTQIKMRGFEPLALRSLEATHQEIHGFVLGAEAKSARPHKGIPEFMSAEQYCSCWV